MERSSDEKKRHFPVARELLERFEIVANSGPMERWKSLRADSQRVADGQPDAFFPDV